MTATAPDRATPAASTATGVLGLHHVATVSRGPARSADFYERVLGLRSLGTGPAPAVREGDAAVARWYGDTAGRVGSLVAVVDRPDSAPGAPGIGGTHHFALGVPDRDALLMWKRRFLDEGYAVNGVLDRHYFQSIYVNDPDGTIVELATRGPGWTIDEEPAHVGEAHRAPPPEMLNTNRDRARITAESWPDAVPEVTAPMALQGLHHVTAIGAEIEALQAFVHGRLGMRRVKRTSNFDDAASFHWYWGVGSGAPGTLVTYFERKPERERPVRPGAGQITHYAVAAPGDAIDSLGTALGAAPAAQFGPDGHRFRAVAIVDPDGQPVLVAGTDGPTSYSTERS